MKSLKNLRNSLFIGCLALGALGVLAPSPISAQGKGASKLMFASSASQEQSPAIPANRAQMSCTRCTDGYAKAADTSAKGMRAAPMRLVAVHMCPVCQTKITSVGAGKAKTDKVSHTCGAGSVEASCCMTAK